MDDTKKIFVHKPSKLFVVLSIVIFFIWLNYLPINWRSVDDYGPIQDLFSGKISLIDQYKYLPYWFWGSYPPIWHIWASISYSLKDFGIDLTRYILLIEGYISILISALLMSSFCQYIFLEKYKLNKSIKFNNIRNISDFLSITIIGFNPQIVIHSTTYMPYNLGFITTTYSLLFIYLIFKKNVIRDIEIKYYFGIHYLYAFLILLITSTFIFQTYFVIFPALFLGILIKNNIHIVKMFREIKQSFKNIFDKKFIKSYIILNISFITFVSLILISYFRKFLILYKSQKMTGSWAKGIDDIYDLNILNINIFYYLKKLVFNLINIIGQSLYPYKYQQINFSLFFSILVILSIFIFLREKNFKFIFSYFLSIYFFAILLATFSDLILSPTRQNIYLLPIPIFFIICLFVNIFLNLKYYFKNNLIFIFPLVLIFNFYFIGFSNSLSKVNYPKDLRLEVIQMAKESDYYLDLNYINKNNSPGFFQSHGTLESNSLFNKVCTKNKIIKNKSQSFKLFLYSYEEPINFNNRDIYNFYIKNSRGCLDQKSNFKVLKKIEYKNHGYEQNIKIKSKGNLYAYLLLVE